MRHTANILGGQPGWSGDQEIRNIPTYPATGLGLAQILCINQCMNVSNVDEKTLRQFLQTAQQTVCLDRIAPITG